MLPAMPASRDFDDAKTQIKDSIDLLQLVGESMPLKRTGSSYKGLCPFHGEKTPSFHVFPASQTFKCFGCGKGGDVFTWVMETESLGFVDAMRLLAERAGVEMPAQSEESRRAAKQAKTGRELLSEVQGYYLERLGGPDAAHAREYLESRGLGPAKAIFGIGYMPGPGEGQRADELVRWLRQRGASPDEAVELGLVFASQRGGYFDRFRHRLSFPIHDERGRVVGFGGRILPGFESEREPKYLNSPESPLFSKRRLLFGLHQARTHKATRLVVMEGYTDVIMAQLAGVHGAVATLGTALTRQHATLLRRFSSEGVILLFDGDAAGRRAAERAFHVLAPEELDARICLLPEGLDPADLVQQEGAEALEAVLEDAKPAWEIFVELLGQRCDLATPDGRSQAASACKELLGGIEESTRRRILGEQLARSLMLPDGALLDGVKTRRSFDADPAGGPGPDSGGRGPRGPRAPRNSEDQARDTILAALLADPGLMVELEEHLGEEEERLFPKELPRRLLGILRDELLETGEVPSPASLLDKWMTAVSEVPAAVQHLTALTDLGATFAEPQRALLDGVRFLERKEHDRRLARLKEDYRRALISGDQAAAEQLERELQQELQKKMG
jgi:DNA primase